jgi:uncharacterized protein YrrD
MLTPAKSLEGFEIRAPEGVIGTIEDLYFDDQQWRVRYLVIATGAWLDGRKVLIAPTALAARQPAVHYFSVDLSFDQIRNGPEIDTAKSVSRQHEEQLHRHFAWPIYWGGPLVKGGLNVPVSEEQSVQGFGGEVSEAWREAGDDPHLRSAKAVRDYHIEASDGAVGHVEDLVVDERSWAVRYLLIDTRNWWPGKKVTLPPSSVRKVSWLESSIWVDRPREVIKSGPEFDQAQVNSLEYADRLDLHYRGTDMR